MSYFKIEKIQKSLKNQLSSQFFHSLFGSGTAWLSSGRGRPGDAVASKSQFSRGIL